METRQRQTAFKVRISDLLNGKYVVQEGWEPNYIMVGGVKVSRVNIMGVIVSKQSSELGQNELMVLDDGSGRISVRSFEELDFSRIGTGDVVLLIGRPREYGDEIYIVPEVIRALDDRKWVEVRKKELEKIKGPLVVGGKEEAGIRDAAEKKGEIEMALAENEIMDAQQKPKSAETSPAEKIMGCIRNADRGDGADFEEVLKEYNEENAERIINGLLKRGDIFELKPGKLKVLE